jgi:hypothetical protein
VNWHFDLLSFLGGTIAMGLWFIGVILFIQTIRDIGARK